ncbi:sulfite exporter TauE/SafE family protein [Idiomarina seosinensis]|uniref:Sulfite exporter TauE/SafE family protein n=2 Tax=Idiomarina seosinensis TaxID=281739 RepID=A0A432ZJS1_9GAMM|nr:sulfite exporter TauE/SafE family protein [Idiomarina seosinensis]
MGLAGAGHCLAMCGGIASAIGVQNRLSNIVLYNFGRMLSYILLGAIVGGAVALIAPDSPHTTKLLRWLAVIFLLALGLYFTGWWPVLTKLEQAAKPVWQQIKRLAPKPQQSSTGANRVAVLFAGAVWGWLPCGLVYSALSYAAISGSATGGGLIMAAFAIGTFPAMIGAGYFSHAMRAILQAQGFRTAIGLLLIIYSLWTALTLVRPYFN